MPAAGRVELTSRIRSWPATAGFCATVRRTRPAWSTMWMTPPLAPPSVVLSSGFESGAADPVTLVETSHRGLFQLLGGRVTDVADQLRGRLAEWIDACRPALHRHARDRAKLRLERRSIALGPCGNGHEPRRLAALIPLLDRLSRKVERLGQRAQQRRLVFDLAGHDTDGQDRAVVGQRLARAVDDSTAGRLLGRDAHRRAGREPGEDDAWIPIDLPRAALLDEAQRVRLGDVAKDGQTAPQLDWHLHDGGLAFTTGRGGVSLFGGQTRLADAVADVGVAANEQLPRRGRLCARTRAARTCWRTGLAATGAGSRPRPPRVTRAWALTSDSPTAARWWVLAAGVDSERRRQTSSANPATMRGQRIRGSLSVVTQS